VKFERVRTKSGPRRRVFGVQYRDWILCRLFGALLLCRSFLAKNVMLLLRRITPPLRNRNVMGRSAPAVHYVVIVLG